MYLHPLPEEFQVFMQTYPEGTFVQAPGSNLLYVMSRSDLFADLDFFPMIDTFGIERVSHFRYQHGGFPLQNNQGLFGSNHFEASVVQHMIEIHPRRPLPQVNPYELLIEGVNFLVALIRQEAMPLKNRGAGVPIA